MELKKLWLLSLTAVLLCGCAKPAIETVSDVYLTQPFGEMRTIRLELPDDAAESVMEGNLGARLYLCNGYELRLQTLYSGNLDGALQAVTGFGKERLTVMKTRDGECDRYDCVWCAAGEGGDQVGRTMILDDGEYYYCVSATADSGVAYELREVWWEILDSVSLG